MLLNCGFGEDSWVPWTARSNQSILKEINPENSLEGLMLKLTLQYFGHLMWRADSLEKTLILGKIESRRKRGWQRMRWLDGIFSSIDVRTQWTLAQWTWVLKGLHAAFHGIAKSWTWLSHWTVTVTLKQVKENRNQILGSHLLKSELETQVPAS